MRVDSFRIQNYKSFRDSGMIQLKPGFNIFIGQNNAGKTAILEALSAQFTGFPHKSSIRPKELPLDPNSTVEFVFNASGQEIKSVLISYENDCHIPLPSNVPTNEGEGMAQVDSWLEPESVVVHGNYSARAGNNAGFIKSDHYPSHRFFKEAPAIGGPRKALLVRANRERTGLVVSGGASGDHDTFSDVVCPILRDRLYCFRAERLNVGEYGHGHSTILLPDARNLPEVINVLQSNPGSFRKFNEVISEIFPNIRQVTCRPTVQNRLEILVWNRFTDDKREDLAIPLQQSGTGIGQVLAILYVVLTSERPQTIIIDEPNTFLHPGALRKLLHVMQNRVDVRHQYIISTHSPAVLSAVEIATLHQVRWENEESHVTALDGGNVEGLRQALHEVGARLSDVFGADRIAWVEGVTEQECFPKILNVVGEVVPIGTSIVALINTGDIESRRQSAYKIREIYQNLSTANALMPPALVFSLDREGRNSDEIQKLSKLDSRFSFLPRRCYENYLLHPEAIAAVLNELPTFKKNPVSPEVVENWLRAHGGEKKYKTKGGWNGELNDPTWLRQVHAPSLLKDLFSEISETKEEFGKMQHSVRLTEIILEREPDFFTEIVDYLKNILDMKIDI